MVPGALGTWAGPLQTQPNLSKLSRELMGTIRCCALTNLYLKGCPCPVPLAVLQQAMSVILCDTTHQSAVALSLGPFHEFRLDCHLSSQYLQQDVMSTLLLLLLLVVAVRCRRQDACWVYCVCPCVYVTALLGKFLGLLLAVGNVRLTV